MAHRLIITLPIALAMVPAANAAGSFFCKGELSTGFRWDGSKWAIAKFTTENDQYLIRPYKAPLYPDETYGVYRMGEEYPRHICKNTKEPGYGIHLVCGGLGYGFIFSEEKLRFQDYYGIGYISGEDGDANTPALTIGKCSPID